jgi:hypothetical protein
LALTPAAIISDAYVCRASCRVRRLMPWSVQRLPARSARVRTCRLVVNTRLTPSFVIADELHAHRDAEPSRVCPARRRPRTAVEQR